MNNFIQIYSQLVALRKNIPSEKYEKYIGLRYVNEYNSLIDNLATESGISLDNFKVSESMLEHTSGVFRPRMNFQSFDEKHCERGLLLAKLDAALLMFRLKEEKHSVGFQPPETK